MADKLADLSPEEKEKRIAEMKAKMQAAAAKNKPAGEGAGEAKGAPAKAAKPASVSSGEAAIAQAQATSAAAHAVPAEASAAVIEESTRNAGSDHPAPVVPAAEAAAAAGVGAAVVKTNGANGANGAGAAAAPVLVAAPPVFVEETAEQKAKKEMNRREFLTYAWGATLGLLVLQAGVGTFFFMYPRFKAGEFGGKFVVGPVDSLPPTDAAPIAETAGKFWLVNTEEEGPKALYMVCTHLGCLYKWAQSNNRFECPRHGSKFSREGFYIEGPASRSLDMFEITEEAGMVVVNTGKRIPGAPAAESPDRVVPA